MPVNTGTKVTLNLSSNGDSNGETNFPHRLSLTHEFQGFVKLLGIIH